MPTPETAVKNYLREELSRLSAAMDIPISVIPNPAGSMSVIGRPDVDIIIANVLYIHAEIKADGEDLSPAQEIYKMEDVHGFFQVCIAGKEGVEHFIDGLPILMITGLPKYQKSLGLLMQALNANLHKYIQDRARRKSVAAKGPRRQSADLH